MFQLIFVILTTPQGFLIFVRYTLYNDKLRDAFISAAEKYKCCNREQKVEPQPGREGLNQGRNDEMKSSDERGVNDMHLRRVPKTVKYYETVAEQEKRNAQASQRKDMGNTATHM